MPKVTNRSLRSTEAAQGTEGRLLGREFVLGRLRSAVDDAIEGRGGVVLLTGDAGIGKTAATTEAAAYAERRGARVLWGPSWEGEGVPGYWPWVQILRAYLVDASPGQLAALAGAGLGDITHLIPELIGLTPLTDRGRSSSERSIPALRRSLGHAYRSLPIPAGCRGSRRPPVGRPAIRGTSRLLIPPPATEGSARGRDLSRR